MQYEPINTEQLAALQKFARAHGRCWKEQLRKHWDRCSLPGVLHALRNSHGPSWLRSYRLPVEA